MEPERDSLLSRWAKAETDPTAKGASLLKNLEQNDADAYYEQTCKIGKQPKQLHCKRPLTSKLIDYGNIADYEQKHGVKVPEDITTILRQQ